MTPEQLNSLAGATALGRLSHSEQHAVFAKLIEIGYAVTVAVPPAPVGA